MDRKQRRKIRREFLQLLREHRKAHPDHDILDCLQHARDEMETIYGESPDWETIFKIIMELILALLVLFG